MIVRDTELGTLNVYAIPHRYSCGGYWMAKEIGTEEGKEMTERKEISGNMTVGEVVELMCEDEPLAFSCICELMRSGTAPALVFHLDDMNIRGKMLYAVWSRYCNFNIEKFEACVAYRDDGMIDFINREVANGEGGGWLACKGGASYGNRPCVVTAEEAVR